VASLQALVARVAKLEQARAAVLPDILIIRFITSPERKPFTRATVGKEELLRADDESEKLFSQRVETTARQRGVKLVFVNE
jgi:hypothetical protein